MKQSTSSEMTAIDKAWSPAEIVAQPDEPEVGSHFFEWWYRLTAVPEAPSSASFVKREEARRIRLLSTVLLFFLPALLLALPTTFFIPNEAVRFVTMGLTAISFIALYLNRAGKVLTASIVLVVGFQLTLMAIVITTMPLDETALQLYDLFILIELFAVSLLPVRSVFLFALCNSTFILADIFYHPRSAEFNHLLTDQFWPIISRPLALQFIVAGVAFLWVSSAVRAIHRADRAEMVARLEHTMVQQKRELEEGIQQILQTHVAIANGNLNARAPLTEDNVLWQIARALNTLLVRLQRASLAEKELYRVEQAVHLSVCTIQNAEQQKQLPRLHFTQTSIDPLIVALQGKTLTYAQAPFLRHSHTEYPETSQP